jgi:hypothetical protein
MKLSRVGEVIGIIIGAAIIAVQAMRAKGNDWVAR